MTVELIEMTEQERLELVDRHASSELVQDFDTTWDTLDPEGSYDYFPLGIRITGREAMDEQWRRLFGEPALEGVAGTKVTKYLRGEDVVITTQVPVTMLDGQVAYSLTSAVFSFRGDKIFRESVFADGLVLQLLEKIFDEEFRRLPGVSSIPSF